MPESLDTLFLLLFAGYLGETLWTQLRGGAAKRQRLNVFRVAIQVPLFVLAAYLAVREGAIDRRLVSLIEILPGLALGHLIFVASVLATHTSLKDAWAIFIDWESLRDFFINNPYLTFRTIQISFTEEVIYRVALQSLLVLWWGPIPAILVTAIVFTISHEHVFRNSARETAEFVAFSLLLGTLYYATTSLAIVVAIHVMRNFEIASLEFAARAHDLGSEEEAQRELDQRYRQESVTPS